MPLTVLEQLQIINGTVAPPGGTPLKDIVEQIALNEVVNFYSTAKTIDSITQPLANMYLNKMNSLATMLNSNSESYTPRVIKILIGIYADVGDFATVQAATDNQWITFLENNILKTLEILANVLPSEKTEYNSI